ncbi:MAG: hypothetical protein J6Q94_02640 [Clostridia bacterium]|nr:hypothetical protein [Clostridia bacterium]
MKQDTAAGSYRTEYYLMLVPEKIDFKPDKWGGSNYAYTPLCGVPAMNIPDELENNVFSIEERGLFGLFSRQMMKTGQVLLLNYAENTRRL